jgi:NitT/TauT family transport system substrate-binding protein
MTERIHLCGLRRRTLLGAGLAAPFIAGSARAETISLRIARQFGVGYAQMALLEEQKLIEQHAAAAGLAAVEVTWSTFRSSDVMNDALLSGSLDIASLGVPGLATIWDRTTGKRMEVKGLVGFNVAPLSLVSRDPSVKTIADYKPGMKIALPAVKVSNQAIFLQMAAAKFWGPAEFARLDPLTVSMSHPDALIALLSGGEITSYFGAPPFHAAGAEGTGDPRGHELGRDPGQACLLQPPRHLDPLLRRQPQTGRRVHRRPARRHRRDQRRQGEGGGDLRPRHR